MSNEIATRTTEIATRNGHDGQLPVAQAANIPNAVTSVMEGLKQAITEMKADDLSVELSASQEGNRSSAHFRIRAYRNGRKVIDESGGDKE
jgi:hypothetical protein